MALAPRCPLRDNFGLMGGNYCLGFGLGTQARGSLPAQTGCLLLSSI